MIPTGLVKRRILGSSGITVPALGFGLMRLPLLAGRRDSKRRSAIDEKAAVKLVRRAYDLGIDYFDTAWGYHAGWSEAFLRRALAELPRPRVMLADKLPIWLVQKPEDTLRYLRTQLRRVGTDYFDFYLIHALNARTWPKVREHKVLESIEQARRDGRIRHIAFSFHDKATLFREIVDAFDWTFAQVQYNIVDTREQAGNAGVRYAAKKGLGVVVMEPLRGGDLVRNLAPAVERSWARLRPRRSPAEWQLRWLWDQPEVSMVLSGMSSIEQLIENAAVAAKAKPRGMNPGPRRTIARIAAAYRRMKRIGCTGCEYCLPCPNGVRIPPAFRLYNEWCMFPGSGDLRQQYRAMRAALKLDACTDCGVCEAKCPQKLPIPELIRRTAATLGTLDCRPAATASG